MITITDGRTDTILDDIDYGDFWNDNHHKSLKDNIETFDFTTFADKSYSQYLTDKNRIVIPDEDGTFIEFEITNSYKYHGQNGLTIEVYTSASYLSLQKAKVIRPQKLQGATAKSAAQFAVEGTEFEVGEVHYAGIRTINIERHTNPFALLKRIAREFNLELRFRVVKDSNKIVKRYVDLLERVGEWQGREAEFGKDLISIERKEDTSNIVTALIGIGPEREDGERLEVFVEDKEALQRWGRRNPKTGELMHIVETYEPQSEDTEMTESRLRELTKNELEKRINALVEYVGYVSDLEKVPGLEHEKIRFGDTIKLKDTSFNPPLYLEARIHTQDRSLSHPEKKKVTLGDYIEYTEEEVHEIWKQLQAEIAKKVSMAEVTEVVYTKPEVDQKDNEVKDYAEGVAENKKQEAIQISAEDATNKANQAENRAKNHADTIAEQKKQEAINAAIADADAKLSAAKTELEADIALKADAEWVNGQLVLKENAITKSNTAPANPTVGQLWLDTSVTPNVLKRWSGSEWVKATPTSAGEVGAYTKSEVDNALNSKVSVTQYNTDMNGVVTRLNSAESRITQNENEIATKVSNTQYQQDKAALENDISALETRVSNAETAITQNANEIALKANKTDIYTKTEIDGQFSTVNQQISQLDAELSVQADQIATKVSRTEFESLQIGGRNLLRNSVFSDGLEHWESNGSISLVNVDGKEAIKLTGTTNGFYQINTNVEENTYYTISFKAKSVGETSSLRFGFLNQGPGKSQIINVDSTWRKYTFTTTQFIDFNRNTTLHFYANNETAEGVYITEIKLEKGNKATDWTPAPEDVQGQIDGLGSRMTTAETSITQLSDQIALKANQSTVDTLTGQVSSIQSQLTLMAGEISTKVEKDGVISAINQTAESIKIQASKVDLAGYVTFTNLSTPGQTTIDGGNLKTGSVTTDKIAANAITADKLNVTSLSAISADLGSVTAGELNGVTFNAEFTPTSSPDNRGFTKLTGDSLHFWESDTVEHRTYNEFYKENRITIDGFEMNQEQRGQYWMSARFDKMGIYFEGKGHPYDGRLKLYRKNDIDGGGEVLEAHSLNIITGSPLVVATGGEPSNRRVTIGTNGFIYSHDDNGDLKGAFTGSTVAILDTSGTYVNLHLRPRPDGEVRVTSVDSLTTYRPIRASSFPTASSILYKTNVELLSEEEAMFLLDSADVFTYHLKSNVENGIYDKPKIGMISEMVPQKLRDEDGVDPYSIVATLWKVVQVQKKQIENLTERVTVLEEIA